MKTDLTKKLGIKIPLIQSPMAGVSTPALAAAVSNAGALGSLSVGAMNVEQARTAIEEIKAKTAGPFNINVFCHESPATDPERDAAWLARLAPFFESFGAAPPAKLNEIYRSFNQYEELLILLLETRPPIVSFHFGLPPAGYIAALKDAGLILIASATNLDEAQIIEEAGIDAVVAQGWEAGGHRGIFNPETPDDKLGTLTLTRLLVRETSLPVIAAGGIMDGAGIAAALALGAGAAQLGTAFIACPESSADDGFKAALLSEAARHTVMTAVFSGRIARGIPNRLTVIENEANLPPIPEYPRTYDATKALQALAAAHGSSDFSTRLAGQSAPLSRPMPAAELVKLLEEEIKNKSSR